MNAFAELVTKIGPARIAAMGAVAALLIGFFAFVILRVSQPQMAPLYTDLTFDDSAAVIRELEAQNVAHEIKSNGATILVPREQVLKIRMQLAEDGLPTGGSVGYELFDKTDTLGTTSFVQNINHLRALEGELARTIRTIDRVASARVHLVLPERELFRREKQEPSASIALKVRGSLEPAQIRAIQHLAASAVEGLKAGRVSIVDETGRLLASGDEGSEGLVADSMLERRSDIERRLRNEVEDIVGRVVGPGRARVQVAAELDFNRITLTSDTFDPDGQVVRSSQTRTEAATSSAGANGGVTVGNELPGATPDGGNGQGRDASNIEDETVNYEISRTTKTETLEAGGIKRLSVAVLVDGVYAKGADGEVTYTPRPQDQIDQIAALVRSAVGFDQGRGDQVEVVNLQFAEGPSLALGAVEEEGFLTLTKEDYFYFAELALILLLTLIVLFFVVRPLLRRVLGSDEASKAAAAERAGDAAESVVEIAGGTMAQGQLTGPQGDDRTGQLIDGAQLAGEMQAASIQKVGDLVRANPGEAVTIIRAWLQDAA